MKIKIGSLLFLGALATLGSIPVAKSFWASFSAPPATVLVADVNEPDGNNANKNVDDGAVGNVDDGAVGNVDNGAVGNTDDGQLGNG